jgi:hypothetical protein
MSVNDANRFLVAHWHLLGRDDEGRLGLELENPEGVFEHWWFVDDDQLRRVIIHLISVYLNGKMPDPQAGSRG